VLQIGDRVPEARVQRSPGDEIALGELAGDRSVLFVFYLFDWSST
jgi:peroxiredoxin